MSVRQCKGVGLGGGGGGVIYQHLSHTGEESEAFHHEWGVGERLKVQLGIGFMSSCSGKGVFHELLGGHTRKGKRRFLACTLPA
jgi:hypothetical protein